MSLIRTDDRANLKDNGLFDMLCRRTNQKIGKRLLVVLSRVRRWQGGPLLRLNRRRSRNFSGGSLIPREARQAAFAGGSN